MANPPQQSRSSSPSSPADPDLLAAVVLHTLVRRGSGDAGGTEGMTLAEVATACERDPTDPGQRREVQAALEILLADELATSHGALWRATRAAIRAAALSF